jgi:hypothetical protein
MMMVMMMTTTMVTSSRRACRTRWTELMLAALGRSGWRPEENPGANLSLCL